MRTITLLAVSILLAANVMNAKETKSFNTVTTTGRFSIDEPISFTERGIEFFVFDNGEFDFNTRPQDTNGGYYYKGAGKRNESVSTDRSIPNYGVIIERDNFGRIRRIGNTFINYDFNDRVNRIGTVFMSYNRFALAQVGGLQLIYNRYGELVDMIGSVKGRNAGFTYNYYGNGNNGHHYGNYNNDNNGYNTHYQTSNNNNNDDYYYYKADGTRAKVEDKKE